MKLSRFAATHHHHHLAVPPPDLVGRSVPLGSLWSLALVAGKQRLAGSEGRSKEGSERGDVCDLSKDGNGLGGRKASRLARGFGSRTDVR